MTGSPIIWENQPSTMEPLERINTRTLYNHIDYSYAKYIGGHPSYPKSSDTGVYFYNDRLEIVNPKLLIPYSAIIRIENMDEKKIDRDRVVLGLIFFTPLAIHAAIRKKKHTYTIIQYNENREGENKGVTDLGYANLRDLAGHRNIVNEKTIVLDFGVDIHRVQPLVYNKMIEFTHDKDNNHVPEIVKTNRVMPLDAGSFEKIKSSEMRKSLQCSKCGNNNSTNSKFCTACGQVLMIRCDKCDHLSPGEAAYCGGCGLQLPNDK